MITGILLYQHLNFIVVYCTTCQHPLIHPQIKKIIYRSTKEGLYSSSSKFTFLLLKNPPYIKVSVSDCQGVGVNVGVCVKHNDSLTLSP